jgi:hypothetical protein
MPFVLITLVGKSVCEEDHTHRATSVHARLCVEKVTAELNGSPKTGDNNSKKNNVLLSGIFWLVRTFTFTSVQSHPANATTVNAPK